MLAGIASAGLVGRTVAQPVTPDDVRALIEQNRKLQDRLETQQRQIDALRSRIDELEDSTSSATRAAAPAPRGTEGQIRIGGEAAVVFFNSGSEGAYPNSEFRVDDAKVHIEAAIRRNTYLWAELELTTREVNDEFFHVGELYIELEGLAEIGRDSALNLRVGRFHIPFGEEYQHRSPLANPLISHSASDIWGIDEGIQAYGSIGRFSYNLAVQNGGHKTLRDFNSDKAIVGRVGFDPGRGVRLSASAMTTGDLDSVNEPLSEVWLANAFFRPLGAAGTSRTYSVQMQELDAAWQFANGHLRAAAGWIDFEEVRTTGRDDRALRYYNIELSHRIVGDLHGALRYSEITTSDGYPIAGQADDGKYFYNPFAPQVRDLSRLSAGLRYQFGEPFVWKIEYSRERTKHFNGTRRGDTDLFSSQLGVKF